MAAVFSRSGGRVVGQPGTVRGADLAEACPRLHHDVRHPEATADFDELSPRDQHFAAVAEGRKRDQRGGGVVVHDDRSVRAGEAAEEPLGVLVAMAARAALEIVFEVGVPACDAGHVCDGSLGQRSASQVRVDDHASRVDDFHQRRRALPLQACRNCRFDLGRDI